MKRYWPVLLLAVLIGCGNEKKSAQPDSMYVESNPDYWEIRATAVSVFDSSVTDRSIDSIVIIRTPNGYFDLRLSAFDCISNGQMSFQVVLEKHMFDIEIDSLELHEELPIDTLD